MTWKVHETQLSQSLSEKLCSRREARQIIEEMYSTYARNDRCPHIDFQGKADIVNAHVGIAFVELLNLLERIKIPFHISNMCFLWHNWLALKISHRDSLSLLHTSYSKKITSGSISRKAAWYKRSRKPYSLIYLFHSVWIFVLSNIDILPLVSPKYVLCKWRGKGDVKQVGSWRGLLCRGLLGGSS